MRGEAKYIPEFDRWAGTCGTANHEIALMLSRALAHPSELSSAEAEVEGSQKPVRSILRRVPEGCLRIARRHWIHELELLKFLSRGGVEAPVKGSGGGQQREISCS